jgi:hypothetical protein
MKTRRNFQGMSPDAAFGGTSMTMPASAWFGAARPAGVL